MSDTRRRVRIALVTTELAVGGAERCLTNLALGLDRSQFDPQIYSLAAPPPEGKALLVDQLRQAGVPTHFLGVRSARQFFTAVARLTERLRQSSPDVVQTFLFHANVVGTLAAGRASVPHRVMGVRVADPRRWRARLERRLARGVDAVVCVSESVAQHCRTWGFPADKLQVVPNGIDVERYAAAKPADLTTIGIPASRRVIAFVGRLDRQKGLDWLMEALPHFFESASDCQLLVVGDGPERAALEGQASEAGLADHVTFAGWRPDVPEILSASVALVLPSRWEGMPNVLAEAMAAGLPVVATRAEGVRELLGPTADLQSVEYGDKDGLVSRLLEITSGNPAAASLGAGNRIRIAERFSLATMICSYEALYRSL